MSLPGCPQPQARANPAMAEPWFLAFNASVEIHPVMVPEDLLKTGPAIAQAVTKYRRSCGRQLTSCWSGRAGPCQFVWPFKRLPPRGGPGPDCSPTSGWRRALLTAMFLVTRSITPETFLPRNPSLDVVSHLLNSRSL
jgi:hypothetical protein